MMYDARIIHALYRKLLTLYPREFREQLGESMAHTFNDLCNERQKTEKSLFGFMLWMFTETAIEIIHEHLLLSAQGDSMKNISSNPKSVALVDMLFIAPFLLLNAIVGNRIEPFFSLLWPGIQTGPFE